MAKEGNTLSIQNIETAPITQGQEFGPCLLSPGLNTKWTTGGWDGDKWFDEPSGLEIQPQRYMLLPD
jgi:hypothetical protein